VPFAISAVTDDLDRPVAEGEGERHGVIGAYTHPTRPKWSVLLST